MRVAAPAAARAGWWRVVLPRGVAERGEDGAEPPPAPLPAWGGVGLGVVGKSHMPSVSGGRSANHSCPSAAAGVGRLAGLKARRLVRNCKPVGEMPGQTVVSLPSVSAPPVLDVVGHRNPHFSAWR